MSSIHFPESFVKMIMALQGNFTRPSFRHFQVVLSAILLGSPKKTLTAGIRLTDLTGHFSNVHRFLGLYKWELTRLVGDLLSLLCKVLPLGEEPVFALDDTLVPKYGPHIFGRGTHFDHAARPNRPKYIQGHNWVVLGLMHYCDLFSKWLCFPLLAQLFIPEKILKEDLPFRSRIQMAVEMMTQLKAMVNKRIILVADGLYAKKALVRHCIAEDISFVSRLRIDACLYKRVRQPRHRGRGRPRKYGKRMSAPKELAKDPEGFVAYRLKLYGKQRTILVKRIEAMWKPAGQPIQVLIVRFDDDHPLACFFSTDLSLSVERIVRVVAARVSIETLFSDLKVHLGMNQWQCRTEEAVVRSVPLTCVATTLLMLWSLIEARQQAPEFWDVHPWETQKTNPSVLDMMHQLKAKCISAQIFHILQKEGIQREKYQEIERILKRAA